MSGTGESAGVVLHYLQRWLEVSAQFVHAHVTRSRYQPVVVSFEAPQNVDRYPIRSLHSLGAVRRLPVGRARRRAVTAALGVIAWRGDVDLVHVHFGYRIRDVEGLVTRRRLPLVVSLHGEDATAAVRRDPGLYVGVIERASAVIVPSRHFAGIAAGLGASPDMIEIIPAGVDTAWFTPAAPQWDPVVTFVGRFVEKKGLDVLLAAWPAVRAAVPEATLRLCGYGPLVLGPGVAAGIEVVHAPDRHDVRELIRSSRLVVSPSRTSSDGDVESLLLVNLEAAASGRPVVSTRHGGIPEYVADGQTGLLVGEGDPDALGEALVRLLTDDALMERLGRAGPAWAARFDVRRGAASVDAVYDRVLEDPPSP